MAERSSGFTKMSETSVGRAVRAGRDRLTPRHLSVLFWLGVAFLAADLLSFGFDKVIEVVKEAPHAHGWIEYAGRAAILVVGLFLVMPRETLNLLMAVPLPAFLQRGRIEPPPKDGGTT